METLKITIKNPDECGEHGIYDFGVCIPAAKSRTFEIYKGNLMRWIRNHSDEGVPA